VDRIYTHDIWYWDDDPFDQDHSRKKMVMGQTHTKVEAPFHRDYGVKNPITVPKKKPQARVTDVPGSSPRTAGDGKQ
jgi:hypothetical protein